MNQKCPFIDGQAMGSRMLSCKGLRGPKDTKHTLFDSHEEREQHIRAYCHSVNHEVCTIHDVLRRKK